MKQGSVSKAAKALGTTAVNLAKAIERRCILQRWVAAESSEDSATGQFERSS
jgi:hypothetical protein